MCALLVFHFSSLQLVSSRGLALRFSFPAQEKREKIQENHQRRELQHKRKENEGDFISILHVSSSLTPPSFRSVWLLRNKKRKGEKIEDMGLVTKNPNVLSGFLLEPFGC